MNFEQLLKFGVDQGASAIHLQAESSPQLRIGGLMRNVEGSPLKADELKAFITSIGPKSVVDDIDRSLASGSIFSTSLAAGRFRCTIFNQIGGPSLVLRLIPSTIKSIEELNLPRAVREIALASRGLTLVVGPNGSGKSTTLAAMVDVINAASYQKIVTIENPVEILHANKKAMMTQMEVGRNVTSFEHGVGLALTQDADVIVVGDLREEAVARMVLGAAEAGQRVLAVMTGLNATQAIARFVSLFPLDQRETALSQLATALGGVIAQQLAKTRDGKFRPAVEVFRGGAAVSQSILDNRLQDLRHQIASRQGGMQSLDQHLIELNRSGVISGTETMRLATNPEAVGTRASRRPSSESRPGACRPGSSLARRGSQKIVGRVRVPDMMINMMKAIRRLPLIAAALVSAAFLAATIVQAADPLPSWNDRPAKQSIITFVEKVTKPGSADFVPVPERIATFDNDGTLWCEQPLPVQLFFALDRVKVLAPQHPEWKDKEPFASLLKGDLKSALVGGRSAALEILSVTHAGMTTVEFEQIVKDWIATAKTSEIQEALHRAGLSADARAAGLSAGKWLQDLHRLRRRHRVHAPVGRAGLRHPAGTGRRQQHQDEV